MMAKALLFDNSKCTGCRGCQSACKQWWDLPATKTTNKGSYENPPDLGAETYLRMKFTEVKSNGGVDWLFTRHACMHCTDAACVWVCPAGARAYDKDGYVTIDQERCIGCGRCVVFCPFEIPRLGKEGVTYRIPIDLGTPKSVTYQCIFCADRTGMGLETACAKTCPPDAIVFGDRDDLLAQGKARVSAIKSRYPDANLYGENEVGGLHVMFVLTHQPTVHGLPADPKLGKYPEFDPSDFPEWYKEAIAGGKLPVLAEGANSDWYLQPGLEPTTEPGGPTVTPPPSGGEEGWGAQEWGLVGVGAVGAGAALWWIIRRRQSQGQG
jgi:formate dehydrogenase iron-sulfur subunit